MNKPSDPLAALWRAPALLGVLLGGEALAAVLALAPSTSSDRIVSFGLASLVILWITLGTLCLLYLLRKPLARLPPMRALWVTLGLLLGMTLLVSFAAWSLLQMAGSADTPRSMFMLRILAIAIVVGLVGLVIFQNYAEAKWLAIRAQQLELESLQARIRPHFLFNTLNTSAALVHARPDEAEQVLLDLADLFRSALRGPRLVPLEEELALTRRYLDIEALRLGNRLQLAWQVPDSVPALQIPSLSVQPLAENAIRHGVERLPAGGCIAIRLEQADGWLSVVVENDMPNEAAAPAASGHRIGLRSARERVRALGDGRADIETRIRDGRHLATVRLPLN